MTRARPRCGVILVVVLALLALFAGVALTFLLYAQARADAARAGREALAPVRADVDADLLASAFLGQFLYDAEDDEHGVLSALRGHSLARSMYGFDDAGANDTPYNGTGRLHTPSPLGGLPDLPREARDDYNLVNYTYFPADGLLRDPERLGGRRDPKAPRGPFLGGSNAPYTYPDLNNLYLAAVKADGAVLVPSYHRSWLFGSNDPATNPNWTNAAGKYLLLRPRPADMGPGFPYPEDDGGDVKNNYGAPGGNDSYWLDLGFPVLTAPDGKKFKPLFAPLVVDLDGRVNLNVHGNVRGRDAGGQPVHASNQGWGPWEVNVGRVLPKSDASGPEWPNLFLGRGSPRQRGRYGPDGEPARAGSLAAWSLGGRSYSRIDADACRGNLPTGQRPLLAGSAGASTFACFPLFPPGYDDGSAGERLGHPSLYNPFRPGGDDRAFPPSTMEYLLAGGPGGTWANGSEPGELCPNNFADARVRSLVTTLSADVDRPGAAPWVWDPSAQPYALRSGSPFPSGNAIPFPTRGTPPPPGSDFGTDWRSLTAKLGRVALDRPLPSYPRPDPSTGRITDLAGFLAAQSARTELARALFDRLRAATGATEPAVAALRAVAGAPGEFEALRWLAQLAANIVDFIDDDDFMTPLDWYTDPALGAQVVLGTELPRVVINEVYAEAANDPADRTVPARASRPYQVNFWVELHNPLAADATLSDGGAARLQTPDGSYAAYRLVVAAAPCPALRRTGNVLGEPDIADVRCVLANYAPAPAPAPPPSVDVSLLLPANGAFAGVPGGNNGFYVVGPAVDFPGTSPARPQPTLRAADGMSYALPLSTPVGDGSPFGGSLPRHTLLLQRLACPALPPNPAGPGVALDPGLPFNPYVTVDYVEGVPTNDGLLADAKGQRSPPGVAARASFGRRQPYAALSLQQTRQQPVPPLPDQPQHTFFRHNARDAAPPAAPVPGETLQVPFDWLKHFDRLPVSPGELLSVSAFKPHELTQRFRTPGAVHDHRAPWLDPSARLFRFLEFVRCRPLSDAPPGGRLPGLININTLWDPEVFLAACDPQVANNFTLDDLYRPPGSGAGEDNPSDPQSVFGKMLSVRTPNLLTGGVLGPDDRPFLGLAAPFTEAGGEQYPAGAGLDSTLLRRFDVNGARRLLQPPLPPPESQEAHPAFQTEMLSKVLNHFTTRSHVFAVWLTVGFFEVTDLEARPVKLGAEVGRAQGRQVRTHLFAVVDRSRMALFTTGATNAVAAPGPAEVTPKEMSGQTPSGRPWAIRPGTMLTVGASADEETIVVSATTATTFTANFTRPHAADAALVCRGNPGPWPRFNHHGHGPVIASMRVWRE